MVSVCLAANASSPSWTAWVGGIGFLTMALCGALERDLWYWEKV